MELGIYFGIGLAVVLIKFLIRTCVAIADPELAQQVYSLEFQSKGFFRECLHNIISGLVMIVLWPVELLLTIVLIAEHRRK